MCYVKSAEFPKRMRNVDFLRLSGRDFTRMSWTNWLAAESFYTPYFSNFNIFSWSQTQDLGDINRLECHFVGASGQFLEYYRLHCLLILNNESESSAMLGWVCLDEQKKLAASKGCWDQWVELTTLDTQLQPNYSWCTMTGVQFLTLPLFAKSRKRVLVKMIDEGNNAWYLCKLVNLLVPDIWRNSTRVFIPRLRACYWKTSNYQCRWIFPARLFETRLW